jgi:pyruvate/2-oxoglutarate dehydrogenase complex dihydrolipoamide dehydrogenase (E3) component
MKAYDLVVIGSGTAAQVASTRVRKADRTVAVIEILGAHIVGPHADEVISLFGLAIRHNLTARDLQTTMFAYPTGASDIGYMV